MATRKTRPKMTTWHKPSRWAHIPGEPTRPPIVPSWAQSAAADSSEPRTQRNGISGLPAVPLMGYQEQYLSLPDRMVAWLKARQIGGSWTKALKHVIRVHRAEEQGRGHRVVILSATKEAAQENIRYCAMHARAFDLFRQAELAVEESEEVFQEDPERMRYATYSVKFPGSGHSRIIAIAANPFAVGRSAALDCDELSRWRDPRAVWDAAVPTVTRGNLPVDLCSTPRGVGNLWHDICDHPDRFGVRLVTTNIWDAIQDIEIILHLLPEDIACALRIEPVQLYKLCGDDKVWAQNYLCSFIDLVATLLSLDQLFACSATGTLWKDLAEARSGAGSRLLFAGWDVARRRDLSVLWILELLGDVLVTRWTHSIESLPYPQQKDVVESVMSIPGMRRLLIDETGVGLALKEFVQQKCGTIRVGGITFTGPNRVELSKHLKGSFEDKLIRVPDDQAVRDDFRLVKKEDTLSSERIVIDESGESHADRFWACALARYAAYEWLAGGFKAPQTAPGGILPSEIARQNKRPNISLARRFLRRVA